MTRPGFYPRGGGQIVAHIQPRESIRPLQLKGPTTIESASIVSAVAGLPDHVANRQARRATVRLRDAGLEPEVTHEEWPGGPGSVLMVTLAGPVPTLFFGLGPKGSRPSRRRQAARTRSRQIRDAGGPHSADQLLLPLALADGDSEYHVSEVTRHLTTNATVIKQFLDRKIEIDGAEGTPGMVRVSGGRV